MFTQTLSPGEAREFFNHLPQQGWLLQAQVLGFVTDDLSQVTDRDLELLQATVEDNIRGLLLQE